VRNKYHGICYRCKKLVESGKGHFERFGNGWRVQHVNCAIKYRSKKNHKYRSVDENKLLEENKE